MKPDIYSTEEKTLDLDQLDVVHYLFFGASKIIYGNVTMAIYLSLDKYYGKFSKLLNARCLPKRSRQAFCESQL